ncbi:hypothetical protein COJ55_22425 [Bacillus cereus]|nr:hypothetical protein COJ55_22425 [Bacillus cereus]
MRGEGRIGPFFICRVFATLSYKCDMVVIVCSINATCEGGQVREIGGLSLKNREMWNESIFGITLAI